MVAMGPMAMGTMVVSDSMIVMCRSGIGSNDNDVCAQWKPEEDGSNDDDPILWWWHLDLVVVQTEFG